MSLSTLAGFPRPTPDQIAAFAGITAATAHEALGRRGALDSAIKPVAPGQRLLGPAFPVACPPGDNLTLHLALALARPGDVLVCAAGGFTRSPYFGDVMATAAREKGLGGVVVDGAVRDAADLRRIGFPVFARAVVFRGGGKAELGPFAVPVVAGGVLVRPGDLVIGDDDGVAVVPLEEIDGAAAASRAREAKEERFRQELRRGLTTWDLLDLSALLRRNGIDADL